MTVADDLPPFLVLFFAFCFLSGVCESVLITQWPRYISTRSNDSVEMHCYQNDTNYQYLYWYKQLKGRYIQQIVYLVVKSSNFEKDFQTGFKAEQLNDKQWSLTISSIQEKDEAVYLCAASSTAYFGAGTKLTVLEEGINITEPKVEIIQPSKKECRDKNNKRKKTLLCVASDFYPDHVTLSWETIGGEMLGSVATDSAARRNGMFYKLTSRLRVPAHQWFNPGIEFKCTVNFFNGSGTEAFFAVVKCMLLKT
uniref:Ig-like domain-containing protein n=1 Tax=Kryptolebias marmoratus TaxID=37003 RepID=A0A3Q3AYP4_KRYMA